MQDEELRSYLRQYLESSIDQDRKLKKALNTYAHILKSGPSYRVICAQLTQLSDREAISEKLLEHLDASNAHLTSKFESRLKIRRQVVEIDNPRLPPKPLRPLDEFEEKIVQTYNEEPERWSRKFRPVSFGAANVDEIWRSGGEPKFTRKDAGIYHLIEDSGRFYVVPEPGLKLQESYFRSEGIGHLFDVAESDCRGAGAAIFLVSPAQVEESGDRWLVSRKGELRERASL
jgi:hypothetical protein